MADTKLPTEAELDEMHAREQAATPGPWSENRIYMELRYVSKSCPDLGLEPEDDNGPSYYGSDPKFIAHSRADTPRLIALGRAFYAQRRALRELAENVHDGAAEVTGDMLGAAQWFESELRALLGEGGS